MRSKVSWLKRLALGGKARIEIYEMLALLLENRELLIDALRTIREVYNGDMSDEQKKDVRRVDDVKIKNIRAEAIHSWIMHLKTGDKDGYALARGVEPWIPQEETALIQSGEATGNLVRALHDCVKSIQNKGQMIGAVMGGTIYPFFLFGMAYYVMRIFATRVIPRFETQVDPEMWEGPAKLLYVMSHLFNDYSVIATIVAVVAIVTALVSLPYLRGPFRIFLDRYLPPWNIYRMVQGATFLKNVAVQTRAGIILIDSVSAMREMSSPWMKERLQATLYGIQQGQDLGMALYNAGYEFPDRRAVQILRVLASRDGFDETIYNFAERWQEQTVKSVKVASAVMLSAGLLSIGFVTGTCFMGMQGISDIIQDSADSVTKSVGR